MIRFSLFRFQQWLPKIFLGTLLVCSLVVGTVLVTQNDSSIFDIRRGAKEIECESNSECGSGLQCVGGQCKAKTGTKKVSNDTKTPAKQDIKSTQQDKQAKKECDPECLNNDECGTGYRCAGSGHCNRRCEKISTPKPLSQAIPISSPISSPTNAECTPECTTDIQCGTGYHCKHQGAGGCFNVCQINPGYVPPSTPTPKPTASPTASPLCSPECFVPDDCASGYTCHRVGNHCLNYCEKLLGSAYCSITCYDKTMQCLPDLNGGTCVIKPSLATPTPLPTVAKSDNGTSTCVEDTDCPTHYSCQAAPGGKYCILTTKQVVAIIPAGGACSTTNAYAKCDVGYRCITGICQISSTLPAPKPVAVANLVQLGQATLTKVPAEGHCGDNTYNTVCVDGYVCSSNHTCVPEGSIPNTNTHTRFSGAGCTEDAQCISKNCSVQYAPGSLIPKGVCAEKTRDQEYNDNLVATYNTLNSLTGGSFGNYVSTYQDINAQNPNADYLSKAFDTKGLQASGNVVSTVAVNAAATANPLLNANPQAKQQTIDTVNNMLLNFPVIGPQRLVETFKIAGNGAQNSAANAQQNIADLTRYLDANKDMLSPEERQQIQEKIQANISQIQNAGINTIFTAAAHATGYDSVVDSSNKIFHYGGANAGDVLNVLGGALGIAAPAAKAITPEIFASQNIAGQALRNTANSIRNTGAKIGDTLSPNISVEQFITDSRPDYFAPPTTRDIAQKIGAGVARDFNYTKLDRSEFLNRSRNAGLADIDPINATPQQISQIDDFGRQNGLDCNLYAKLCTAKLNQAGVEAYQVDIRVAGHGHSMVGIPGEGLLEPQSLTGMLLPPEAMIARWANRWGVSADSIATTVGRQGVFSSPDIYANILNIPLDIHATVPTLNAFGGNYYRTIDFQGTRLYLNQQ